MYSIDRCHAVLRRWGLTPVPSQRSSELNYVLMQDRDGVFHYVRKFDKLDEQQRIAVLRNLARDLGEEFAPDC